MDTTMHAAMHAAMHAPLLRATVVVTYAFGGGATKLVELLEILRHGGISQVTGWCAAKSAELIVRGLKPRMEKGGVKVISIDKY